jgi:hypothetical protein
MVKYQAKYPAAFINALAESGSRDELIQFLQKTWDELCDLRKVLLELSAKGY